MPTPAFVNGGAADAASTSDAAARDAPFADAGAADAATPDASLLDATAQVISVGKTVHGTIGSLSLADLAPALDVYAFAAAAGTALGLTVTARDTTDYRILAEVYDELGYSRFGLADPNSATRELFIPSNGTYYVLVSDLRDNAGPTV